MKPIFNTAVMDKEFVNSGEGPPGSNPYRILVLWSHLQPFLSSNLKYLARHFNAEIVVIHWKSADEAPFTVIDESAGFKLFEKQGKLKAELTDIIDRLNPHAVICSGWMDKDYLRWTAQCERRGAITIMAMDNQWKGGWRQYLNTIIAPFFQRRIFRVAWVPGAPQQVYARRLGFRRNEILTNLYTPDVALFNEIYKRRLNAETHGNNNTFLYTGRLVDHKVAGLLRAWKLLSQEQRKGWKLIIAGNGPLQNAPEMSDPDVISHPYATQAQLGELAIAANAFCLTSSDEAWGTVIQEFAITGLPLVVSRHCGAAKAFLQDGVNGFLCDGDSVESIQSALLLMINSSETELQNMGRISHETGMKDTNQDWARLLVGSIERYAVN